MSSSFYVGLGFRLGLGLRLVSRSFGRTVFAKSSDGVNQSAIVGVSGLIPGNR